MRVLRALRRYGVLGINRRNADYTLRWNRRASYPTVDDKLLTKVLCRRAGIPAPALLGVARHHFELRALREQLRGLDEFALKPARGAMGNGIVVVCAREGGHFLTAGGRRVGLEDLVYHAAGVISGLYALAGQSDVALVEERLEVHPSLAGIAHEGVPDIRVVVYRGLPAMAMTRLPTRASGGRANLHQGAVAAGIDFDTGRTTHAILHSHPVDRHPDTDEPLVGRAIPSFDTLLEYALRAGDETGLGYVGVDMVVDARRGPMLLEMNARPGLMVQLANRAGLLPRLRAIDSAVEELGADASSAARIERARAIARETRRATEPGR
jgi:alpha-L-glutamate ligase-like protein